MWRLESFLPYPPTGNTLHLHQDHGCSSQSVTCVQQRTVHKAVVVDVRSRHRVVTEFLTGEGCSLTDTHRLFTVRHWVRRFESGEEHTGDMPRRDRTATASTSGIVNGSCYGILSQRCHNLERHVQTLTLILLTWRIGWAHNNARK